VTTLQPRDAYKLLAAEYDFSPNALVSLEQRTLAPLLPVVRGRIVIDVAAGTGRWASYCRDRGAHSMAVDSCWEMLERAGRGPAPLQADASRLPLSDRCSDVTICAFALGYAPECFAELARITRSGGTLLVSDVHPEALERGWTRSFRYSGGVVSVAHESYSIADLHAPDLELTALEEPLLGEQEREIYARAGRLGLFEEACQQPAIFVARWIKT
jgi:ubiquinone/menaquinone biosynthesis C-methylase UbiE